MTTAGRDVVAAQRKHVQTTPRKGPPGHRPLDNGAYRYRMVWVRRRVRITADRAARSAITTSPNPTQRTDLGGEWRCFYVFRTLVADDIPPSTTVACARCAVPSARCSHRAHPAAVMLTSKPAQAINANAALGVQADRDDERHCLATSGRRIAPGR